MRKSDIQEHDGMPAVNVKCYDCYNDITRMAQAIDKGDGNYGPAPGFAALVEAMLDKDDGQTYQGWWDAAAESEIEYLASWADGTDGDAIFPHDNVKMYQVGRSCGWLAVDGLRPVEEWDAIAVARWSRFARIARSLADGVTYQALSLILFNVWEVNDEAEQEIALARY